jgi:hypothetical protein
MATKVRNSAIKKPTISTHESTLNPPATREKLNIGLTKQPSINNQLNKVIASNPVTPSPQVHLISLVEYFK